MARYDRAFTLRARRALAHGIADAETFQALAVDSGVSVERVAEMLQEDLENEGPIFGKFMRSLRGAATASVSEAQRTGMVLGSSESVAALEESIGRARGREGFADMLEDVIDDADPEELERLEAAAGDPRLMWVAMLVNTCNLCLPLHGSIMFRSQWEERGLIPGAGGTLHEGWNSECKCRWVGADELGDKDRTEVMAPLRRVPKKTAEGLAIKGRTVRAVAQEDVDKARKAAQTATQTKEGRRTLRIMGQVMADEEEEDG